jgi:hypothetical protein
VVDGSTVNIGLWDTAGKFLVFSWLRCELDPYSQSGVVSGLTW